MTVPVPVPVPAPDPEPVPAVAGAVARPPFATAADEAAMALALDEARAALETGDVPVGAVVVAADGTVLGRGRNRREADADPTAHAEVLALRAAAAAAGEWRLAGCSLVVTLEPCLMCAGAAVLARVDRVVLGAWDPKAGACGSQWDVVRDRRLNHRPEVVGGVLEAASAELLRAFFDAHRGAGPEEPDRPVDEVPVDEVPVDEVLVDEVLVDRRPGGAG